MKIAFPTEDDQGVKSIVYGHFGSANAFMIVDSDTGEVQSTSNVNRVHDHGQCQPIAALGGQEVHAVVVGAIGAGALMKFNGAGIRVYRAVEGTIEENLEVIKRGQLPELTLQQTCAGHSHHDGKCSH